MLKKIKNRMGNKIYVYDNTQILQENADYNIVIGERSDGKTFSVLDIILNNYLKHGEQGVIVRRWADDFKRQRGKQMWDAIIEEGRLVGTQWDNIKYVSGQWWLTRYDEDLNKDVFDSEPFCHSLSLASMEHDKSTSYSKVTTILFDEFMSRQTYLPDEFVLFMNVVSTVVRHRDNVKIWMCANTVTFECPYFKEFGIKNIRKLEQGSISVYNYGESGLRLALEYLDTAPKKSKPSDKYFAFDNPKLQMITGGKFEMAIYPHLQRDMKYNPKHVRKIFFVKWDDTILHCDIVVKDRMQFIYVHQKTTPIKDEDRDLVFSPEPNARVNWRRNILQHYDEIGTVIYNLIMQDHVFYQDNEIGEVMRNYLQYCRSYTIIRS